MLLKPRQNRGKRELRKCRCGAEALWRREVMHKIANFKDNYSFNARSPLRLQVPSVLFMQKKRLYPILRIQSSLVRVTGLEPVRHSTHAPQTCLSANSSTLAFSLSDPDENRTRVTAVKGRCLNRLTTGPLVAIGGLEPPTFRV